MNDLDWAVSPDGSTIRPLTAADRAALARLPGVARFIRDEDASSTAEDAIIIADDRQHQGVARLMLERPQFR